MQAQINKKNSYQGLFIFATPVF